MQQIIDFIIRKKDVVVYFILLLFSLSLIFNSNYFHRSKVIILLNNISSFSSENFDYINEYFELKDINLDLTKENLFLKNQLEKVKQYSNLDSLKNTNFTFRNAKVISNNLSSFKNHLIINKGVRHGLKNEMGVINSTGMVGIINRTSKNYSSVMSVLNIDTKINAKVKRTSHFGTLEWNGRRTSYLVLNDIPETANIKVGDSIITGGMSLIFPEGINIGVVSEIINQNKISDTVVRFKGNINEANYLDFEFKENYLTVKVKLHTDMNNLNNVYVIESLNRKEFQKIKK
ncbi:rod shape-determining protein MreC [Flavobacteriaceae bacterium]|nr:rod shape-determining protein MreC [Flavobacteriaceae bacterium]MDB4130726.1 rod shape-determining protein MreC [Flavobacteriaceae bacterium]MDB9827453.1 rod shape-determining protein MreC [Flavobacteriaceae bacterium]MDC1335649.1 rod shape-determining protein MreC [Flavobacteriaceae bacterium]MDC1417098.1 rod shape-determining protein MreC [Flavobacteriaceae bacterium]